MNILLRKSIAFFATLPLIISLASCGAKQEEEIKNFPPAFSVIKNEMRLKKQAEKDSPAEFTTEDFEAFFGNMFASITIEKLPDEKDGVLALGGKAVQKGQSVAAAEINKLKFVPNEGVSGALFTFKSDVADLENKEFVCELVFREGGNNPPLVSDAEVSAYGGINVSFTLPVKDAEGDGFDINVISYPKNGSVEINGSELIYTPDIGFSGTDTLVYGATDEFGAVSGKASVIFNVGANSEKLVFDDMIGDPGHIYAYIACSGDKMTWAQEDGKTLFEPEGAVTRIEFLVMAMSAAGWDERVIAAADTAFDDDKKLGTGVKGYLNLALAEGVVSLGDGSFSPLSPITAGDAADITAKMLSLPLSAYSDGNKSDALYSAVSEGFVSADVPYGSELNRIAVAKWLCGIAEYSEKNR